MPTTSSTVGALGAPDGHAARPLTGQRLQDAGPRRPGWRARVLRLHHLRVLRARLSASCSSRPPMPDWLRQLQTYGIFAAGYLARPLGGIIMAHFGDLLGRKTHVHPVRAADVRADAADGPPAHLRRDWPAGADLRCWSCAFCRARRWAARCRAPGCSSPSMYPHRRIGYACGTLTAGLTAGILLGSLDGHRR